MIKYHVVDSMTIMKAIELIEKFNWAITQNAQNQKIEPDATPAIVLKSLRNALNTEAYEHQ